jgi:thymidylate kinase
VFDRFCFGQFVYNDEKGRKITEQELETLVTQVFPQTNTLFIYVDLSTEEIIKRLIERGEGDLSVRTDMEKWINANLYFADSDLI